MKIRTASYLGPELWLIFAWSIMESIPDAGPPTFRFITQKIVKLEGLKHIVVD